MTVIRAPSRIDFAGGWSDVPRYADEFGGEVLNAAISVFAEVSARPLPDRIRLEAEDLGVVVESALTEPLSYDGRLDLHKAALRIVPTAGGVELVSRTEAPPGSGLGTSGSLDVALVVALAKLGNRPFDSPEEAAESAFQLEAVELGLTGGRQDQYAAAIGGFQHLRFSSGGVSTRRLVLSPSQVSELEASLVIAYTGQTHFSAATHDRVWQGFDGGVPDVVDAIHSIKSLVAPATDALLAGDWRELARIVDENWLHQQRLHESIATDATRATEDAARRAGAWAAKAMGAGAGGCMLFVGPQDRSAAIADVVESGGGKVLSFRIELDGVRVVR